VARVYFIDGDRSVQQIEGIAGMNKALEIVVNRHLAADTFEAHFVHQVDNRLLRVGIASGDGREPCAALKE
jgi:hypothetical protein